MSSGIQELTEESAGRFVQTKPFRIHYYEAGSGHPMILLHGSGAGATGWSNFRPNIAALAERFHVYAVDMPGWGKSDTMTAQTGRDHPAAVLAFMDELGIERAALVGNSLGGMTSVTLAIKAPERVSHLVTMGAPVPGVNIFSPGGGMSEGMKVLMAAYVDPSPASLKKLVQIMCFDPAWATDELATLRSTAALARPDHVAGWNAMWAGEGEPVHRIYPELGPELPKITAPTLAIHGRDDRVVSYEHSLRLVSAVPNSRLLLINQCGHWAQIEHAAEFNATVSQFVGGAE
jgi:2-hydroxy-6-oxonona-2,4-dienedioate hydrolase